MGPATLLLLFAVLALCAVMLAIPGLRRPPPGREPKMCPACEHFNSYKLTACEKCGEALKEPYEDADV